MPMALSLADPTPCDEWMNSYNSSVDMVQKDSAHFRMAGIGGDDLAAARILADWLPSGPSQVRRIKMPGLSGAGAADGEQAPDFSAALGGRPMLHPYLLIAAVSADIRERMKEALNMHAMAGRLGISVRELRGLFKRVLRMSPRQYLMKVRVERAKELLENTQMAIADIAREAGFYDHSALNRSFVKFERETPSSFRSRRHFEILSALASELGAAESA